MWKLLEQEELKFLPVLILANKQDLSKAQSVPKLTEFLDLYSIKNHSWNIQGTSADTGTGLNEGLAWLCEEITKSRSSIGSRESYVALAET